MTLSNLGERPHAILDMHNTIPDVLLPEQCYTRATGLDHEKQQAFAIALIKNAVGGLRSPLHHAEDLAWLMGEITHGVTFEACCEALGVEQDVILGRLGKVRARATGYRSNQ